MKENLIIIHGGGPTAVLNCSLYGAVREAQASGLVEHVYGAVGGTGGLLKEKLLDFGSVPEEELERLPTTPATAIGTLSSAMTIMVGSRLRSTPSRVTIFSPSRAMRTWMCLPPT